jgi:hypothetical protein
MQKISKSFDDGHDAKALHNAMKGLGTDEKTIIAITGNRSNAERLKIRATYKAAYGEELLDAFRDELSGEFRKVIIGMYRSPVEYDVEAIFEACEGMGTDEDTVTEILGSRTSSRLAEIKNLYQILHKESLEKRIISETSGNYKKLLVSILQCKRDESNFIDNNLIEQDVLRLYKAGEGKWGTDEEVFNEIFALRSASHLAAMNQAYLAKYKKDLFEIVDKEFSGDIRVLLKTILHSHINTVDYFATRIYKACKGAGTNDKVLIRVLITMDEVYMEEIKKLYKQKYKMTLEEQIKDECSGDYKNMLIELVSH